MLTKTTATGDRLAALENLRQVLAENIDDCGSKRDLAALATRLQSVLAEIEEIRADQPKGDFVDQIAARREARRSATSKRGVAR